MEVESASSPAASTAASTEAYDHLATLRLGAPSRMLPNACCPDKDLLVLITRVGTKDRLSLWKVQGGKKWEVDVDDSAPVVDIAGIAWSPDGQSIAVAHNPPRVTLLSIQDGREERTLVPLTSSGQPPSELRDVWWFESSQRAEYKTIPDLFRRNNIIPGSALSVLKILPLLDPMKDDSQPLTATELFAFQGTAGRKQTKSALPDVIQTWPTLPSDPLLASIKPAARDGQAARPGAELDAAEDANLGSLLIVADAQGDLYPFLDGSFPLGVAAAGSSTPLTPHGVGTVNKDSGRAALFLHRRLTADALGPIAARPSVLSLPLMDARVAREAAQLASAARALVWYATRCVSELRGAWQGDTPGQPGACEFGARWLRVFADKQKAHYGPGRPEDEILQLTQLLCMGRKNEALEDLLGSSEHTSERGLQKWESTLVDVLTRMRDDAERRIAPALQRLHLILEDVLGCAALPGYELFQYDERAADECLQLLARGITVCAWLAATAREEIPRAKHFIAWLRYESGRAMTTDANAPPPPIRHDALEVNAYLTRGLQHSAVDAFFAGPLPTWGPAALGVPAVGSLSLTTALASARAAAAAPGELRKKPPKQKNLEDLPRNLDALVAEVSTRARGLFVTAAGAVGRSFQMADARRAGAQVTPLAAGPRVVVRERFSADAAKDGRFEQWLALWAPQSEHRNWLVFARLVHGRDAADAALECRVVLRRFTLGEGVAPSDGPGGQQRASAPAELVILDVAFFDERDVVLVVSGAPPAGGEEGAGPVRIGKAAYRFEEDEEEVKTIVLGEGTSREELWAMALEQCRSEPELPGRLVAISRTEALDGCGEGVQSLSVNGRVNRRVACVLSLDGLTVEILDLEEEEEAETAGSDEESRDGVGMGE